MSSLSFLSVYLTGAALILLLTAVCDPQYEDYTPTPDYDLDYNGTFTFDYSLYSNGTSEDLDKLSERYIGPVDPKDEADEADEAEEAEETGEAEEDDTGGSQDEEKEATVTMATTRGPRGTTERGKIDVRSAASLPVSLEISTLLWTLMILMTLNTPQL